MQTTDLTTRDFLIYLADNQSPIELRTTDQREDGRNNLYVGPDNIKTAMAWIADMQHQELDVYYLGNRIESVPTYENGNARFTRKCDITSQTRLLVDIDTDDALLGNHVKGDVLEYVECEGIIPEYCISTGSGGYQIVLRLDELPVTVDCKPFLKKLADKFNRDGAVIDTSVGTPHRLMRLPGTKRFKGGDAKQGQIEFFNDQPTLITATGIGVEDYFETATQDKRLKVTFPIEEIRKVFESKGIATSNHDLGFTVDCPHGRTSESNILVTVADGMLNFKCQHAKCQPLSVREHLKAFGIKVSDISTLYNDVSNTIRDNWVSLVDAVEVDQVKKTIETKDGLEIKIGRDQVFITKDNKTLPASQFIDKQRPHWRDNIEAPLRDSSHTLTTPQRLAKRCQQISTGLVVFNNVLMVYENGGYKLARDPKSIIANLLSRITADDINYLATNWGIKSKQFAVTTKLASDVLNLLKTLLPQPKQWGEDLSSKIDLRHSVNYSNGIWLPESNELIDHSPNYFVRPALDFDCDDNAASPKFKKFLNETFNKRNSASCV